MYNPETRAARQLRDKLAAVRLLLDGFTNNCQKSYVPGAFLTVDEELYPFRGRCAYKQYMPSKPSRYGLKFWLLCDANNYFCYNLQMYTGKEDNPSHHGLGERVVMDLSSSLENSGRHITTDNFFTSLKLARSLRSKGMTLLGTLRKNRREVPPQMKNLQGRAVYSSDFRFNLEDQTCLLSYKCKKNDCVLLLSTFHQEPVVDQQTDRKVPEMIKDYNATKGGVDKADQMVATYTVKYISRRWHTIVFCNLLDLCGINAYVLNCEIDPHWGRDKPHKRRQFLRCLGEELVKPFLESKDVPRPIIEAKVDVERATRKKDRCQLCGWKKDRKTRKTCARCGNHCCDEHSNSVTRTFCTNCA